MLQIDGIEFIGVQYKYWEMMLFFFSQGQICYVYCMFCFCWLQFVGMNDLKFVMWDIELVIKYLCVYLCVMDILFIGGDLFIMKIKIISVYIDVLIEVKLFNFCIICFGIKVFGYWLQCFIQDNDVDELLCVFEKVKKVGLYIVFMGYFNVFVELCIDEVKIVIDCIFNIGVVICI